MMQIKIVKKNFSHSLSVNFFKRDYSSCINTKEKVQAISVEIQVKEIIESIKDTESFKIALTHKSSCTDKLKSYDRSELFKL